MHLDRGYDSTKTRTLLDRLGFEAHIAVKGQSAPIRAERRWLLERLHAWMNGFGKLRRCTDKRNALWSHAWSELLTTDFWDASDTCVFTGEPARQRLCTMIEGDP